ncbi:MAG: hypothetical protein CSA52_03980 [Gammaproteobacteria bacterium]|nr:MAG: hypothetical protein CSB48_10705 [Pseudomonadota bacterium]PIE38037.1 MAG: hypothetical protein CSA52_03980 [Gammaproteobacteria bacterium]
MILAGLAGTAQSALVTVGTADYLNSSYNLIADTDSNLVWLDYTAPENYWDDQMNWAAGLNLTYNWDSNSGYNVSFVDNSWRLPVVTNETEGYGDYNELAHLILTELGNASSLTNTGDFDNLVEYWYWLGTENANDPSEAWAFNSVEFISSSYGEQYTWSKSSWIRVAKANAIAVRGAIITASNPNPVPLPATAWLFGAALLGMAGLKRKK